MKTINLKELYTMASMMKWYDFENWVAKEMFDLPETVDTSKLTDNLYLVELTKKTK